MTFIRDSERDIVSAVAGLLDCNPFLPARIELEQRALGDAFVPATTVWHAAARGDPRALNPNATRLRDLVEHVSRELHRRLTAGARATAAELDDYHRAVLYLLFQRYQDEWCALIEPAEPAARSTPLNWYERFAHDAAHFFAPVPPSDTRPVDPAHLFALGFQARRAFTHIFHQIFGGSLPAARLRASAWQSIFTHDVRRYREQVHERMADIPTLITGESGTGKELVARAIALSRYVPFDARTRTFAAGCRPGFFAVNLSALSPTLIESELFGHQRGAFTGATEARSGWLETCGPHGAVFIDEIGELDAAIQIKLLRVLQTREFQRIGETMPRRFAGKVIAATHRDLRREMQDGRFRADLYYRICADLVYTPTLREQLAAAPDDLSHLLHIVAGRVAGAAAAERLASEVQVWVRKRPGGTYDWPGNIRELEQCVRNILIRGDYTPPEPGTNGASAAKPENGGPPNDAADPLFAGVRDGTLTADELVQGYCARVHAQTGSYEDTGQRLGLNWRTVRTKVRAWATRPKVL